jgi:excisionase family DNA binding protein
MTADPLTVLDTIPREHIAAAIARLAARAMEPVPVAVEQADADDWLTQQEAAARLRVSVRTIWRKAERGEFHARDVRRIGPRRLLLRASAVERHRAKDPPPRKRAKRQRR